VNIEAAPVGGLVCFCYRRVYRASPGEMHGDDRMTKRPRLVSSNPVTWDIYQARRTPAKWLGTVEAASAEEAIAKGEKEFGIEPKRLELWLMSFRAVVTEYYLAGSKWHKRAVEARVALKLSYLVILGHGQA